MLAVDHTAQLTSYSGTFTFGATGNSTEQSAGTIEESLQPAAISGIVVTKEVASGENLLHEAGASSIDGLLTSEDFYANAPPVKDWAEIPLATLAKSRYAAFIAIVQGMQLFYNPLVQARLLAGATNVGAAGEQMVAGTETTHYTGTLAFATETGEIPAALRGTLQASLKSPRANGVTTEQFGVWIDQQHVIRKLVIVIAGHGFQGTTTIQLSSVNDTTVRLPAADRIAHA
jgi:hypothetical protein